jgi:transcriptional repressor NrdR
VVIKRNGDRESFDRSKLLRGMVRACEKTGVLHPQLENLVDEIEAELQQQSIREVPSSEIGELVLKHLQTLNEVAYIRFASVYQQFTGFNDFVDILSRLRSSDRSLAESAEPLLDPHISSHAEPESWQSDVEPSMTH